MKICFRCKVSKDLEHFTKDKKKLDGLNILCRACIKCDYDQNKHKWVEKRKIRTLKTKSIKVDYDKNYRELNKDILKDKKHRYYLNNKEKVSATNKRNRIKNKDSINTKFSRNYKENLNFRIANLLRTRINKIIKRDQRKGSAVRDLGCTIDELKVYLSIFFYNNPANGEPMSWENRSGENGWQIDHIKPLSSFNLENKEELLKACNFTNLQPLWALDNLRKNAKLDWVHPCSDFRT